MSHTREIMVAEMRRLGGEDNKRAYETYKAGLENIKFQPNDLGAFEATSPDFSLVQIKQMKRIQDN